MNDKLQLVRIAIGTEHALSRSNTAVNVWVTAEERKFLDRLHRTFHLQQGGFHCVTNQNIQIEDIPAEEGLAA